jgi:hypothetical protein
VTFWTETSGLLYASSCGHGRAKVLGKLEREGEQVYQLTPIQLAVWPIRMRHRLNGRTLAVLGQLQS